MPYDVFISYSSADKLTADAVCATLEQRAIRCWIAPRDILPGQDWSEAIIDGLSSAKVFVLLLSATSNSSEQVKREIQNAVGEGMTIVPFRLEDVPLSKHMRYFIGTPHWLDALAPPMESHLERLAKTVTALLSATTSDDADDIVSAGATSSAGAAKLEMVKDAPSPEAQEALNAWDPADLRKIERELAAFIGPMARVLVHRIAAQVSKPDELCERVSTYIQEENERKRFLVNTRSLFSTLKPAPAAPGAEPARSWNPDLLTRAEGALALSIGPLARILVQRASKRASNEDELFRILAEHLPTDAEKNTFLKQRTGS